MISHVHLTNFKCFQQERIPLNRLTVLSGGNGVGKSSVIQSLLLLRQTGDRARLLAGAVSRADGGHPPLSIKLNDEYRLSLGNSATLTNADIESDIVVLGVSGDGTDPVLCSFEASNTKPTTSIACEAPQDLLARAGAFPIFQQEFHYLVAERVGPRDLQPMADQSFISTGYAGEFTAFAISQAEAEGRMVAQPLCIVADSSLFRIQLEAWMGRLVPGAQIFTTPHPDLNRVQMAIGRRGATARALPPANTGFGISYALPVVVSGLLAAPGSMLIVENPEAHLHPGAQTAIGIFLASVASAGVQVLVETHSENVLNGVRLAALREIIPHNDASFLFLSLGEGPAQPILHPITMDKAAELTNWPPGFFDQQGSDLAEMMKARRALAARAKS